MGSSEWERGKKRYLEPEKRKGPKVLWGREVPEPLT
jgi:hypothetical protein